jgi:tetratricopeptide (TPR) repeat protein
LLEAALALERTDEARDLLGLLAERPPGHVPPFLRAQVAWGRGRLAAETGDHDTAARDLAVAIEILGALGYSHWLGRVQTDLAALLIDQGRFDEARDPVQDAVRSFGQLRAAPALERAEALLARLPVTAGASASA